MAVPTTSISGDAERNFSSKRRITAESSTIKTLILLILILPLLIDGARQWLQSRMFHIAGFRLTQQQIATRGDDLRQIMNDPFSGLIIEVNQHIPAHHHVK